MSDTPVDPVPSPPVVDPAPAPDPVPAPTEEATQVDKLDVVDAPANYVEHVLDTAYTGWAYNGTARIELNGQRVFELHDDGTPIQYGTPPDLT